VRAASIILCIILVASWIVIAIVAGKEKDELGAEASITRASIFIAALAIIGAMPSE
jgi:hypothetical protein